MTKEKTKEKVKIGYKRVDHLVILRFPNAWLAGEFLTRLIQEINLYSLTQFKNWEMKKGIT